MADKTDIYIFAHWAAMEEPREIGILTATQAKGKKAFSFEYHPQCSDALSNFRPLNF